VLHESTISQVKGPGFENNGNIKKNAEEWKKLSAEEKAEYEKLSEIDRARYAKEKTAFALAHPKKPANAYAQFVKSNFKSVAEKNVGMKAPMIMKILSSQWNSKHT